MQFCFIINPKSGNEVANGMISICMQDKDMPDNYPALGIIPAGLGNDTARGSGEQE